MARKPNASIGTVSCPITGELAAVRKERGGRLYYVSAAGKITPYTEVGQRWMLEHATLWTAGPPVGTPDWIADNRPSPPNPSNRVGSTPQPVPETDPDPPAPNPDPDPEPTRDDDDDSPMSVFGF